MVHSQHVLDAPQNDERRYMPRWQVENRVIYKRESEKSFHEGQSRDVHCAGACIATSEYIPLNQKLNLTIYLSQRDSIEVNGTVLWNKEIGNQYLVGINFYDVSKKAQDTILKFAFEIKKDDIIKHWFEGWNSP